MSGSLFDAERFVAAVQEVGGRVPTDLVNIMVVRDMLAAQSASEDPALAIVRAGIAGNLSEKKLSSMLSTASQAQQLADYTGNLRATRLEPLLAGEFHAALRNGVADDLINGLRPVWDPAVEFINRARVVISAESSTEHFLQSADAGSDAIELWQGLSAHLATVRQISLVVSHFGPRSRTWPLFAEYAGADNHLVEDVAVLCTNGWLTQDSSELRKPDPHGHKSSPYFRLPLKLHSVASATSRYRDWCAGEWDRINADRDLGGKLVDGELIPHPRPVNPYRQQGEGEVA